MKRVVFAAVVILCGAIDDLRAADLWGTLRYDGAYPSLPAAGGTFFPDERPGDRRARYYSRRRQVLRVRPAYEPIEPGRPFNAPEALPGPAVEPPAPSSTSSTSQPDAWQKAAALFPASDSQ